MLGLGLYRFAVAMVSEKRSLFFLKCSLLGIAFGTMYGAVIGLLDIIYTNTPHGAVGSFSMIGVILGSLFMLPFYLLVAAAQGLPALLMGGSLFGIFNAFLASRNSRVK